MNLAGATINILHVFNFFVVLFRSLLVILFILNYIARNSCPPLTGPISPHKRMHSYCRPAWGEGKTASPQSLM